MEGAASTPRTPRRRRRTASWGSNGWSRQPRRSSPRVRRFPLAIADMGAAGGGNSLEPMRRALAARQGSGPALVVHTDIPINDLSELFELVAGDRRTYLGAEGVFALAEPSERPSSHRCGLASIEVVIDDSATRSPGGSTRCWESESRTLLRRPAAAGTSWCSTSPGSDSMIPTRPRLCMRSKLTGASRLTGPNPSYPHGIRRSARQRWCLPS
jgi:hypothetical protein